MENINWAEVAKEVERRSHDRVRTIVFKDGTITTVSGPFEARKPMLCSFPGETSYKEARRMINLCVAEEEKIGEEE